MSRIFRLVAAATFLAASVSLPSVPSLAQDAEDPAASTTTAPPSAACEPGEPPIDLQGTQLVPEVRRSLDADPVDYVIWRGTAPTFDGMPRSALGKNCSPCCKQSSKLCSPQHSTAT